MKKPYEWEDGHDVHVVTACKLFFELMMIYPVLAELEGGGGMRSFTSAGLVSALFQRVVTILVGAHTPLFIISMP